MYVPSWMPHWVRNGPEASVSLSITFRTQASRRAERVHRINSRLRQLRLSPRPPGGSAIRDRAKESAWVALTGTRRRISPLSERSAGHRMTGPAEIGTTAPEDLEEISDEWDALADRVAATPFMRPRLDRGLVARVRQREAR